MAIQVSGTTVIDGSRNLVNVIGLKTVGGTAILGAAILPLVALQLMVLLGLMVGCYFKVLVPCLQGILLCAGSDLRYATASANNSGTPSGTWGCMGLCSGDHW
jgi:hypothetical protein